jgi:Mg-chelatase subunit ChlD
LDLIEFAKSIIGAFGTVAAQRSFSTVAFATDAAASEAMDTLDALTFTGGRTNHAAAINTCRTSLETSTLSDRKNFLLLITDGNPSEPVSVPEAEAEAAAEVAKSGGVIIVPVMIKQAVSSYLQGISSDGTVLDASDFDAMISLQTTLMAQVECQ